MAAATAVAAATAAAQGYKYRTYIPIVGLSLIADKHNRYTLQNFSCRIKELNHYTIAFWTRAKLTADRGYPCYSQTETYFLI